jgi:DNA mismatch repair protein MutS2
MTIEINYIQMKFKNIIQKCLAFNHVYESLNICSSIGKDMLLSKDFITSKSKLKEELLQLNIFFEFVKNDKNNVYINKIQNKISDTRDIYNTINNLLSKQVLDDIQFFEIKRLALLVMDLSDILEKSKINNIHFSNLNEIIEILDPDKQAVPHFYIYSSYNNELASYRKKYEELKNINDFNQAEKYRLLAIEIEDNIRKDLSKKLIKFAPDLKNSLDNIAYLDVILAKAIYSVKNDLSKPIISDKITEYKQIFNPLIQSVLIKENKSFQPIDINIFEDPCLITGANMSGKTIILKTIELAQYMFQFGFFVPAKIAQIKIVDEVLVNIGEYDQEKSGLSSFATEILNINKIITRARNQNNVLVLVDELARTTNPDEGKAFVSAFIDIMKKYKVQSLITTHYSGIDIACRKLKVKGFVENENFNEINFSNINDFIDYSLVETNDNEVPAEAINIAKILKVDEDFTNKALDYFRSNKKN